MYQIIKRLHEHGQIGVLGRHAIQGTIIYLLIPKISFLNFNSCGPGYANRTRTCNGECGSCAGPVNDYQICVISKYLTTVENIA